jgi:hypothetical protein
MNDDRRSFTGKITYNYKFIFNNGGEKEFNIDLDRVTFNLIQTGDKAFPEWTKLSCFKCPNCILIGIYMVTGGCPIMEKLKPMVRFHLPFATIEETKYRAISMYLLAQYFLYQRDSQPDWDLKKLAETYENIRIVNESFCKRLRTIEGKDANLNAVVVLDIFADSVNFSIDSRMVDDLDYLFKGYLK